MRFLIPKNKITPNTSYYTYSDLNSDNIEVWFDRCDRDWMLPIKEVYIELECLETKQRIKLALPVKRPNPDNPISKTFSKKEFNTLFEIGKSPQEFIPWREIEKQLNNGTT